MDAGRLHLLDALGVGVAGAARGPLQSLVHLASSHPGGRSTVLGSGATTTAGVAALVNGSLVHSLEYDDTHVASVMHGGSVLVPTALAVAEDVGASGEELLSALVLGWEVLVRLGLASPGTLQARGFQTTSAAGPFVAALVSCLLHDATVDLTVDAMGIAGSQPGGTFAFLAGGDTVKAGQPAWAAHSGIWAADLARAGMTGPERVLEGGLGFFELYAGDPGGASRLATELEDLGTRWHLLDAAYKLMPCCHFIHPFVEATGLALAGAPAAPVRSIHCHVPAGAVPVIAAPWGGRQRPATPHDARWSLPYVVAAAAQGVPVDLDLFASPLREDCLELSARTTYEVWEGSGFPSRFPARVEVHLADGDVRVGEVDDVRGGPSRPVSTAEVVAKARENLAVGGVTGADGDALVREVLHASSPDLGLVARLVGRTSEG